MHCSGCVCSGWNATRRLYLLGSITHDPHFRERFAYWAEVFRDEGWEVVSPAEITQAIKPDEWERAEAMRVDIPLLMTCSAAFCIEGWERSCAARCEWSIAEVLEMVILYSNTEWEDCEQ